MKCYPVFAGRNGVVSSVFKSSIFKRNIQLLIVFQSCSAPIKSYGNGGSLESMYPGVSKKDWQSFPFIVKIVQNHLFDQL